MQTLNKYPYLIKRVAMPSKHELLNRLRTLADDMDRLYKMAAKVQAEIRGGIRKLKIRLNNN